MTEKTGIRARLAGLLDPSAWALILIGFLVMLAFDWRIALVTLTWSAFAATLCGVTIILTRMMFPGIRIGELMQRTREGHLPSAIVAAALILFVAVVFHGVTLWAAT